MTQTQQPQRTLRPFIEALRPGNPIGHRNLTLVPLEGEGHGRLEYILAADAIAAAMLTVTEVSEGRSVPELLASNAAEQMILLLDGEELVGAKQNRILNTTVLLPAKSKTKIPVSCVEHGRWHSVSPLFQAGSYSPAKLRARRSRDVGRNLRSEGQARSNQGAVWDAVAENVAAAAVPSPTMAIPQDSRVSMGNGVQDVRVVIASFIKIVNAQARAANSHPDSFRVDLRPSVRSGAVGTRHQRPGFVDCCYGGNEDPLPPFRELVEPGEEHDPCNGHAKQKSGAKQPPECSDGAVRLWN